MFLADFKGGLDYPQYYRDNVKFIDDEPTLLTMLEYCLSELETRQLVLSGEQCANIEEYNRRHGSILFPHILVAIDELAEVTDMIGASKEMKEWKQQIVAAMSTIARKGRACGLHLLLGLQRPDANVMPPQIKANCRGICGQANSVLSQIVLDNSDAATLPKSVKGRFLLDTGEEFQAFWLDDKFLEAKIDAQRNNSSGNTPL